MSIVERAIESTKNRIHYIKTNTENSESRRHIVKADNQIEIQKYILGLLEKEIPKSPVIYTENEFTDADGNRGMKVTYIECPSCGSDLEVNDGCCIKCGQKIIEEE